MSRLPKLHVAVLMGGWASERSVSLMSGEGVAKALEERGHKVTRIDMDREVALRLHETGPDVVFNALHGVPGEDGTVQGMMDLIGVPYTHSGLQTSVIAIDKELTKHALVPHGIPMYILPLIVVIEIISFLSRPVSHSVRLFANMLAGHITLKVFAGFVAALGALGTAGIFGAVLPLAMTTALSALEILVAFLQAYVFAILTCIYLNDALHPGH